MTTIKTKIHAYSFNMREPAQIAAYNELKAKLTNGPHCMNTIGNYYHQAEPINGQEIELETNHLFDNQWNTAAIPGVSEKGLRVFDWAEDAIFINGHENRNIKRGHYLDQTDEMRAIRRDTFGCGYCGKQIPASLAVSLKFCPHCIGSAYLDEETLLKGSTRLRPIANEDRNWQALSEIETAELLPKFRQAQTIATSERAKAVAAKQRIEALHDYDVETSNAKTKRDGWLWLLDHGVNTENVIFYKHSGKFGFGWRKPLSDGEVSALLEILGSEFSAKFSYSIECANGRTIG